MAGWRTRIAVAMLIVSAVLFVRAQQFPLPERSGPLRKAMLLLREGKTTEARKELEEQRKQRPDDAEVLYQIARSYLLDFYRLQNPEQRRLSLSLAMETLDAVLKRNPD